MKPDSASLHMISITARAGTERLQRPQRAEKDNDDGDGGGLHRCNESLDSPVKIIPNESGYYWTGL